MVTSHATDTICAPATPAGGAIAVIRLSGPDAIAAADSIFSRNLHNAPSHQALFGTIGTDSHSIDEVLLTVFRAPHSYTGEDCVEISCHGSAYIQQQILHLLTINGCRMADAGEFTKRAFLSGKMDLTQAEAVADLIASQSEMAHRVAFAALRGNVHSKLQGLQQELLQLTSLLELELDFSEHEDLVFADRTTLLSLSEQIAQELSRLIASYKTGNAIKTGIPVAIVGAPNAGKSSLLNALLGEERAIVSDIAGTTRDVIEDTITIDGTAFRFIDTAGLRHTDDTIERLGIARSYEQIEKAEIILWLTEAFPSEAETQEMISRAEGKVLVHVQTKADLTSYDGIKPQGPFPTIVTSAKTGHGIEALRKHLAGHVAQTFNHSDIIITSARHHAALQCALQSIRAVHHALTTQLPADLISEDLRQTIHHLGTITGTAITSQDTLNHIFSKFCIGK